MKAYTIGVDFGTLSGRAVLCDTATGAELATAAMSYPHGVMSERLAATGAPLPQDFALQDPDDYLAVLEHVIPTVVKEAGVPAASVVGIGIDFTCCTLISVDGQGTPLCRAERFRGEPLSYALLWKHHAAGKYAERLTKLARERGEAFLARCGGKVDQEWTFAKMLQVLCEAPEVYHAADRFVEAGDFVVWQLTGALARGYQYAAYKSHYVAGCGYPSKEYLCAVEQELGETALEKLRGELHPIGTCAGTLTPEFATRLGLCESTRVAAGIPDGHAAAVALGLSSAGDMMAVLGTSGCFMALGDEDVNVPGICGTVKDGILPGFYGFEAGLCCLGDHFAFAAERLTSPAYVKEAEERGISMVALLMEKAAARRPGESGVLALNWFNGNRSTLVDARLSGLFVGMTLSTVPEDLMRALCEATAFGMRNIIENYEANGVPILRVMASGGIAHKNPFLMQLYADVTRRTICVTEAVEAPARSAAIVAAAAAGVYADVHAAIDAMHAPIVRTYTPNGANFAVYDALYAEYRTLHDYFGRGGNDVMGRLRALRGE